MKKFILFAAAVLTSMSMMADPVVGTYSTRDANGATSAWAFNKVTTEAKIADGTVDNGLIFHSSSNGNQKLSTSGYLSNKSNSSIYFPVPSSSAAGTITLYTSTTSDSRWFQLYVNGVAGTDSQRLWSKEGTDLTKKGPRSYTFTASDLTEVDGEYYLCFKDNNTELKVDSGFTIVLTSGSYGVMAEDVSSLSAITINGVSLEDFAATTTTYNVELPFGTSVVPTVAATASQSNETVTITAATALPGATTIVVTSADEEHTTTYTINFSVSTAASSNADIATISVDGVALSGVAADVLTYNASIPYAQTTLPVVTATVADENATAVVTNATEIPGAATVVVTAQDGTTTKTYTINFTRLAAEKNLNEVILSNKYSVFYKNNNGTVSGDFVYGYYLEGENAPTMESYLASEGATVVMNENSIVLTGADETTREFVLSLEAVAPAAFTTAEIALDSAAFEAGNFPAWVKAPYGIISKSGKTGIGFSKTDTDYSREWAGKTHFEMFLPACDTIFFHEADVAARAFRAYADGVEIGDKFTLTRNAWTAIVVSQSAPFMLTIKSAQTGGDAIINKVRMARVADPTAVENIATEKAQKVMIDGQMYIIKNGVRYNVLGAVVK